MVQFTQVLDFAHGRHVEAILKLAHLDLLDGNLATRRELSAWCVCMLAASTQQKRDEGGKQKADLDTRPHTFPLRLFDPSPFWFDARRHHVNGGALVCEV
jgi:hypothetical protein